MARIPMLPDGPPGDSVEPVVAEGIFLSSELDADASAANHERQRATIRAFQIRARQRTTPQGVFAAVAELRFDEGSPSIGAGRRTRTYPNPVWMRTVCDRATENPDVLRGLRFHVNNLAVRRGGRLHVERPAIDPRSRSDQVSIRTMPGIDIILDVCGDTGADWHEITAALRKRWPSLPDDMADAVLRGLVRNGIVLTDLPPDDACNDPIGHLLGKMPATDPLRDSLPALRAALLDADAHAPGSPDRMTALTTVRRTTDELASIWRPIGADCATETVSIPANLASRAAEAANVLWRITSHHDPLAGWHDRFIHWYDTRRLVPLLDACDPVTGLGHALDEPTLAPDHERNGVLARMLSESLLSGGAEVELTDELIDALDQRGSGDRPEASAELYARVLARNSEDRDNGRYFLAVTNRAAPAGSTRARFTGLLPNPTVEPDDERAPTVAELTFQPLYHAVASLTGNGRAAATWRIPIGIRPTTSCCATSR